MAAKTDKNMKLILGLGNKDTKSTLKTVLLYAMAGVRFFDISPEIFNDTKNVLKKHKFNLEDFTLCVSVPVLGDIHGRKAVISKSVCSSCGLCKGKCPQGAIFKGKDKFEVDEKKCIGCGKCKEKGCYAISFEYGNYELQVLKTLVDGGNSPDMVELHCSISDRKQIMSDFQTLLSFYKGDISVCINKKQFPLNMAVELLNKMKKSFLQSNPNAEFYVQADGASMNGGAADENSTLECVEFARELEPFGFNLIISGGTNFNTPKMLDGFKIKPIIAYGTFARNLILNLNDKEALISAKELCDVTSGACV